MSVSNAEYAKLVARCNELEQLMCQAINSAEPISARVVEKVVDGVKTTVSENVYPSWVEKACNLLMLE